MVTLNMVSEMERNTVVTSGSRCVASGDGKLAQVGPRKDNWQHIPFGHRCDDIGGTQRQYCPHQPMRMTLHASAVVFWYFREISTVASCDISNA